MIKVIFFLIILIVLGVIGLLNIIFVNFILIFLLVTVLIFFCLYLYNDNKKLKEQIEELRKENKSLLEKKILKQESFDSISIKNISQEKSNIDLNEKLNINIKPEEHIKEEIKNTFGEYLAKCGKKQLRLAETEKYAHVTFFFNGGIEEPNVDEARLLVNSPKEVATYDLKPEMSVYEVTENFLNEVANFDVTIMNLANGDMVGHTGVYEAAKKAVEDMDICLSKIYNKIEELNINNIRKNELFLVHFTKFHRLV